MINFLTNFLKTIFSFKVWLGPLSFLLILQLSSNQPFNSFALEKKNNVKQQTNVIRKIETIAQVKDVPQGTFNYGGSVCFAPLVREGFHEAIAKAHPSFGLNYVEPTNYPGCGAKIQPLVKGEFSFLLNTRLRNAPLLRLPSLEEDKLARRQEIDLIEIPLAIDGVAVYAHKSLPIDFVTLQQLRDIYLGKLTNWQELGGSDIPIVPVSLHLEANTDLQVLMQLDDRGVRQLNLNKSTKFVRDYTSAIRKVANTPGAIAVTSAAILKGQSSIKPIALAKSDRSIPVSAILADRSINLKAIESESYPLTRELSIVFRNDLSIEQQASFAYSNFLKSSQGKKLLKQAGFVPLSS